MAENKKSFVLYADLIHTVSKMPNNKAGKLFKHILSYVNGENPNTDDIIIQLTFEPVKQQLKRDLKKYEEKRKQWSKAGKRSAEVKKSKKNQRPLTNVNSVETVLTVNDSVNVNEIIDESITYTEKEFLNNWNEARTYFTGAESNLNKLHMEERIDFEVSLRNFKEEDIQKGIKGLFMQKYVPQDIMQFRPKHFLKNIDTYLDSFENKKKNLYKE